MIKSAITCCSSSGVTSREQVTHHMTSSVSRDVIIPSTGSCVVRGSSCDSVAAALGRRAASRTSPVPSTPAGDRRLSRPEPEPREAPRVAGFPRGWTPYWRVMGVAPSHIHSHPHWESCLEWPGGRLRRERWASAGPRARGRSRCRRTVRWWRGGRMAERRRAVEAHPRRRWLLTDQNWPLTLYNRNNKDNKFTLTNRTCSGFDTVYSILRECSKA